MNLGITNRKVDICFSRALESVKQKHRFFIALHLLQCATMAAMIPLDIYVFKTTADDNVVSFFIAALCVSLVSFISKLTHLLCVLQDEPFVFKMAEDLNHVVPE